MVLEATAKTTVTLASLLEDYAVYNLWANRQLVEWLRTKPAEYMESEVASSFSSLKSTLLHIWFTQDWWLANLQQLQPESAYDRAFTGTLEEMFEGIVEQSEAFVDFVRQLAAPSLQGHYDFSIPYVGDFSSRGFEIVQHCMNHSTYHRGQLITIGRNLGFTDAPMTDYMYYVLMVKPQSEVMYN